MSIRLNVVLSQSAGAPPHQRELEAELVAQLIAAPGIDLSLIGPLESLGAAATDRVMLEGMRGDLALLSWLSPAEATELLARAGIEGRRTAHRHDPAPPDGSSSIEGSSSIDDSTAPRRRIYYFDLHQHQATASLQSALGSLLAARRVVTFGLGVAGKPAQPKAAAARVSPPRDQPAPTLNGPPAPPRSERAPARSAPPEAPSAPPQRSSPDRWDALVDELNASDI